MRRNEGKVEPTSTGEIAGMGMKPVNKIHKAVSNVIYDNVYTKVVLHTYILLLIRKLWCFEG